MYTQTFILNALVAMSIFLSGVISVPNAMPSTTATPRPSGVSNTTSIKKVVSHTNKTSTASHDGPPYLNTTSIKHTAAHTNENSTASAAKPASLSSNTTSTASKLNLSTTQTNSTSNAIDSSNSQSEPSWLQSIKNTPNTDKMPGTWLGCRIDPSNSHTMQCFDMQKMNWPKYMSESILKMEACIKNDHSMQDCHIAPDLFKYTGKEHYVGRYKFADVPASEGNPKDKSKDMPEDKTQQKGKATAAAQATPTFKNSTATATTLENVTRAAPKDVVRRTGPPPDTTRLDMNSNGWFTSQFTACC